MTNRENALAILNYQSFDRVPLVHFGFWPETIKKWADEGFVSQEDLVAFDYNTPAEARVAAQLGFDFGWGTACSGNFKLAPPFETRVLEEYPDGGRKVLNPEGVVVLEKRGVVSIPMEIDHLFKGRAEWEEHFKPRLQFSPDRIDSLGIQALRAGGVADQPIGIYCGSLYGFIRDMLGVEGISYLYADDEELYVEVIDTVAELCYRLVEASLEAAAGIRFDFAHYWEDICFKNGPLVVPRIFDELVGPHYRRISDLLSRHGVELVSLDCDGMIDSLIPTWLANGVNTMFPIEVGTWDASIGPWKEKYGRAIRGVGGMNKVVFSRDRAKIDRELERIAALVELGGFLPCPDHRIAPDAKYENVRYYCERFRKLFG